MNNWFDLFAGFHNNLYEAPPRCLNHAFTVHTKYELSPPYPVFAPKIHLKLDGVLIVNTGDSLIALSVDIEDNHGGFGFGLYSPRVTRSVSNISTASSSPSDDQMSCDCDSQDRFPGAVNPLEELENTSEAVLLSGVLAQSPCSNTVAPSLVVSVGPRTPIVPKDSGHPQGDTLRMYTMRERHQAALPGKENQLSSPVAGTLDSHRYETPNSKVHRAWDVYNFEGSTPKKDEVDTSEYYEVVHESPSSSQTCSNKVRATLAFSGYQQSASMGASTEEISLLQGDSMDSQSLDDELEQPSVFQKPAEVSSLRIQTRENVPGSSPRGLSGLTLIPPENFSLSKGLCISPGCGRLEQAAGSSTCSSCVSSPIILQSDSQCFTYSVRRYVECFGRPDSPVDVEGKESSLHCVYFDVFHSHCSPHILTMFTACPPAYLSPPLAC